MVFQAKTSNGTTVRAASKKGAATTAVKQKAATSVAKTVSADTGRVVVTNTTTNPILLGEEIGRQVLIYSKEMKNIDADLWKDISKNCQVKNMIDKGLLMTNVKLDVEEAAREDISIGEEDAPEDLTSDLIAQSGDKEITVEVKKDENGNPYKEAGSVELSLE